MPERNDHSCQRESVDLRPHGAVNLMDCRRNNRRHGDGVIDNGETQVPDSDGSLNGPNGTSLDAETKPAQYS